MNTIRLTGPNTIALKSPNVIYLASESFPLPPGYKVNTNSTVVCSNDANKKVKGKWKA